MLLLTSMPSYAIGDSADDDDIKVLAMKRGMAITNSSDSTLIFDSTYPGGTRTYVANNYVAYYNSTSSSKVVTLTISGYKGTCSVDDVVLIPSAHVYSYTSNTAHNPDQYEFDFYTKDENGNLIHKISTYYYNDNDPNNKYYCTKFSSITIDKAPDFMTQNVRYFSTDGLTYYASPDDAINKKNAVGTHAIYYKLLSYRTTTNYSATDLNGFIAYTNQAYNYSPNPGVTCAYLGLGSSFINYQNIYGVNAAMEVAFANHESAYGKSQFAVENYNFFGVGAVDSDPSNAYVYTSADNGIMQHMKYWMSRYYLDAYAYIDESKPLSYYDVPDKDAGYIASYGGDSRYFGSSPGNKLIGINVKYASDPFHGEKVAKMMFEIDAHLGFKDYDKYSIGVTNKAAYAYAAPNDSSWKLYKYTSKDPNRDANIVSTVPVGMSVTITGETGNYYIIRSEMPINSEGRACYTWDTTNTSPVSFTAYIKKSDVTLVRDNLPKDVTLTSSTYTINKTSSLITKIASGTSVETFVTKFENGSVKVFFSGTEIKTGSMRTGMDIKIYDTEGNLLATFQSVVTGDINGDGLIDITDLVQIKRVVLGKLTLNGAYEKAADTSGDNATDITDLVQMKRQILGKQNIVPN